MKRHGVLAAGVAAWCLLGAAGAAERVAITVERHAHQAPVTLGVPFPKGALDSPDHVRVLDASGREVAAQVSEVASWAPADPSVKWAWVFFFADRGAHYQLEFGRDVRRAPVPGDGLIVVNNARERGQVDIVAGRLHATLSQGDGGFLDEVSLDLEGDGFEADDVIATGPQNRRGSFVDLLDDAGLDPARAVVRQTYIERGSGPLHMIVRVEGEYRYGRQDNESAPFVTRIHAYAGQSYLRVLHTFVYTGVPDKHAPLSGEFPHVATQARELTLGNPGDPAWTQPDDRRAAIGLALRLDLGPARRIRTALRPGPWWDRDAPSRIVDRAPAAATTALVQAGPGSDPSNPAAAFDATTRHGGFRARLTEAARAAAEAEAAEGWFDVTDATRGVAVGIRHFVEEYPKEIRFDPASGDLQAFFWSPAATPMSFARADAKPGAEGSVENWARGLAKTSEAVFFFHDARVPIEEIGRTMRYVLTPSVAHLDPAWYGRSGVYGKFAPRGTDAALDRALQHKFEWVAFNQRWAPWYGMFDYGDLKVRFDDGTWDIWGSNEPAQDFQIWVEFMRSGDPRLFDMAQALSRHTMDVDNTHWPSGPDYRGESNQSVGALPRAIDDRSWTPATLGDALARADHVPASPDWYRREFPVANRRRTPNWDARHALRFFGWTHGHGLPWALWALHVDRGSTPPSPAEVPR